MVEFISFSVISICLLLLFCLGYFIGKHQSKPKEKTYPKGTIVLIEFYSGDGSYTVNAKTDCDYSENEINNFIDNKIKAFNKRVKNVSVIQELKIF